MKVLLVEDEKKVAAFIEKGLAEQAYNVVVAYDGVSGEKLAKENEFDVIILDLMLPGKSGFAVCKSIRTFDTKTPILILTALDSMDDKIEGFEKGADDYLVKPFEFMELLLRIKALSRRKNFNESSNVLEIADLKLDLNLKMVTRAGKQISLTAKEYALLEYLLTNKKRIVSKTEIAEKIWDQHFDSETNTIEVYINFLRRKIDKEFDNKLIHTVVGMGYVLRDDSNNF